MDRKRKIRTVLCTSGGIPGAIVLKKLLHDEGFRVVGVARSVRVFRAEYGFPRGALEFFRRCGALYTIYIWLITTAAEVGGMILERDHCSVGALCRPLKIPIFKTRDLNASRGRAWLRAMNADLIVCAHFDQKLDTDLCDGLSHAAVNIHPSLLPRHRGVEPVLQSLLDEEGALGVTLHRLSEKIDEGRILAQRSFTRDSQQSVLSATCLLMAGGADLLVATREILLDCSSGTEQASTGTYEGWPNPREVWSLHAKGIRLLKGRDLRFF